MMLTAVHDLQAPVENSPCLSGSFWERDPYQRRELIMSSCNSGSFLDLSRTRLVPSHPRQALRSEVS